MLSGFRPMPCYRIEHPERRVVRHPGSLTRLLRGFTRERFRVEVLGEGIARPRVSEALALGINPKQLAWIREVHLCGDGQPWVRARTVIPVSALKGPARALQRLGNRPLGTALFGARPWRRTDFHCGTMTTGNGGEAMLARRSRFSRGPCTLLVTECFLPQLWQDTRMLPMRSHPIHVDRIRPL